MRNLAMEMFRKYCLPLLLLCLASMLRAQDTYHTALLNQLSTEYGITGGTFVFGDDEVDKLNSMYHYGMTWTTHIVQGQDFTRRAHIDIAQGGANPWDSGAGHTSMAAVSDGDAMLLVLWVRGITDDEGGYGVGAFNVEQNSQPWQKSLSYVSFFDDVWTQYLLPMESSGTYAAGALQFIMHLGYRAQELDIAGLALINYGSTYEVEDLPLKNGPNSYIGMDPNAPWRTTAQQRIMDHRTSQLTVKVIDQGGNPVQNASVHVEMLQHDFGFGSAILAGKIANNGNYDPVYEAHILDIDSAGHGFNEVVFENDLKWPAWEDNWLNTTPPEKAAAAEWLKGQDIKLRGHTLVWPGWSNMPDDMENNSGDPEYLTTRIQDHLADILSYPGINGNIADWDVINELTTNRDLEGALRGTPGYPTGREIYQELMTWTHGLDSATGLFLNDYVTISLGGLSSSKDSMTQFYQEIYDSGVPWDGIGFQCHISSLPIGPEAVYDILEEYNALFGKRMKVTEFDMGGVHSSIQYAYMRDFMTILYSHPKMESFLMWGFWDGNHWQGDAPMYNLDWSLKPGGQAFIDLVFHEWRTDTIVETPPPGEISTPVFDGRYAVTVEYFAQDITDTLDLLADTILCFSVIEPFCNTVKNTANAGFGSLRDAIACAISADTLRFSDVLSGDTILLTGDPIAVDKELVLLNDTGMPVYIDASAQDAILTVTPGGDLELINLTLISGSGSTVRGIHNAGVLTFENVELVDHVKGAPGSLISNSGVLINRSGIIAR